jgi:alkylation response protein AidB-like acyl-CoA dehydrogenase
MMPVASALALHLGVATVVERFGSADLKETFLPEMARYETVGALGLSEENAGSDKLGMETTARRDGDEWILDGHKRWVTNYFDADYVLTYAKTGPDADAPHNVSAFLVPAGAFEVDHVWETLGAQAVKSPKVTLSNVRVPDTHRVGEAGEAYVQRGAVKTGVNVPARAVGIARAAVEDAVAYTGQREQFDRPIGDFQGVRWRVAEMAQAVDAVRLLTLRVADLAERDRDVTREMAAAKIHATETAVEVTNQALQLHGGIGYTASRDVERYLRDARLLTIAGGPNAGHRDTLADAVY